MPCDGSRSCIFPVVHNGLCVQHGRMFESIEEVSRQYEETAPARLRLPRPKAAAPPRKGVPATHEPSHGCPHPPAALMRPGGANGSGGRAKARARCMLCGNEVRNVKTACLGRLNAEKVEILRGHWRANRPYGDVAKICGHSRSTVLRYFDLFVTVDEFNHSKPNDQTILH